MEAIAIVLLLIVLGGGGLLVGLIFAIITGSARSERLRRPAEGTAAQGAALRDALNRVANLERGLTSAMDRLLYMRGEQTALEARLAERPALAEARPAPIPEREAPAAAHSEPQVAPAP